MNISGGSTSTGNYTLAFCLPACHYICRNLSIRPTLTTPLTEAKWRKEIILVFGTKKRPSTILFLSRHVIPSSPESNFYQKFILTSFPKPDELPKSLKFLKGCSCLSLCKKLIPKCLFLNLSFSIPQNFFLPKNFCLPLFASHKRMRNVAKELHSQPRIPLRRQKALEVPLESPSRRRFNLYRTLLMWEPVKIHSPWFGKFSSNHRHWELTFLRETTIKAKQLPWQKETIG